MKTIKFLSFLIVFGVTTVYGQITWQKQAGPYGGSVTDMAYHSSGKIYAIVGYSLLVSADNAATWTVKDVGQNGNQLLDVEIDGAGNIYVITYSNLFVSTDGGTTFIKKNSSSVFNNGKKVKKNPSTSTIYVLGTNNSNFKGQIYKSIDGGVNWSLGYNFTGFGVTDIAVTTGGYVFSAEGSSSTTFIERSSDDGVTFSPIITGITETEIASLAVNPAGTKVYCTTTAKIYESVEEPIAWNNITGAITGTISGNGSGVVGVSYLAYTPDGSKRFFVDNNNHKFYTQVVTPSLGAWTATVGSNFIANSGVNSNQVSAIAVKDANNIFFGTDGMGVIKTVNGGGVLSEANSGVEGYGHTDFVIASNGNVIVATNYGNYGFSNIFTSVDGGQTFQRKTLLNGAFTIYSLFKVSGSTIIAFGNQAFAGNIAYRSTDSGVTWATTGITIPPSNCFRYASPDGARIIGLSNTSLYFSANSGAAWNALPITVSGLPANYSIYSFTVDASLRLVAYGYNGSPTNAYESWRISFNSTSNPTTGTATKITTMTNINNGNGNPVFFGNTIYEMGYSTVNNKYYLDATTDGGATWTSTQIANGGYQVYVDDVNGYLFVNNNQGNSQVLYISRDGGLTFPTTTTIQNTSNNGSLEGIKMDGSGKAYALVSHMSLFKTTSTIITPLAPSLLTEVGHGTDRIALRWQDNSTTETDFQVDRFNGTTFDSIGSVNNGFTALQKMYFEDTGLQPNTAYTYRVSALNGAGYSPFITSSPITTLALTAPSIPDNRSWTGSTTNANGLGGPYPNYSAAISIKQIGSTGHYSVSDVTGVALSTATGNPSDANLASEFYESSGKTYFKSTIYYLKPQANGTWNGSNTITLSWRPDMANGYPDKFETINLVLNTNDPTPAAPTNVMAYVYTNTSIEISWESTSFDKIYTVERSLSAAFTPGPNTIVVGTVNYPTTTILDNGTFTTATTYFYRVKSQNGNAVPGVSPYSTVASVIYNKPNFVLANTLLSSSIGTTSGAIWGDFDNDGFDDLIMPQLTFFSQTSARPFVFKNNGAGNFTAVSNSNLDIASYITGTAGDYNNDGKLDVFFTDVGADNFLFKGNGDMTFTKVDPTAVQENEVIGSDAIYLANAWGDYDKDGILDLFVGMNDNSLPSLLFKGNSDGSFTKIVSSPVVADLGFASGASWVDFDNDGDLDLFIVDSGSSGVNRLYVNNGTGTFTLSANFAADVGLEGFSASWGDYNNDEFLDLFIGTQTTNNIFYKNNGNGTFTKQTTSILMTDTKVANSSSFGTAWGDVNNDGYLDLMVSNTSDNQFYINNANPPNNTFTKVTSEKFCSPLGTFGLAFSDYDHNGFLDVAVAGLDFASIQSGTSVGSPSYLFKNNNTTGNFYEIKLKAIYSNRSAIGTRIRLTAGGKTQVREISSGTGFGSENSFTAHFGLGANTTITSLEIKWPSGIVQTMSNITSINLIKTIKEDDQPPVITFTPPAQMNKGAVSSASFSAAVTDNSGTVSSATLSWRKIAGGTFTDLPGTFNGTSWDFAVTESMPDGNGLEYFITAKDQALNVGHFPLDSNTHLYIYLSYPAAQSIIPPSVLGQGGQAANWKIFTIPFELGSSNGISSVLDEISTQLDDKSKFRMLTYVNDVAWGEYPGDFSTFARGKGYFINIKTAPPTLTIGDEIAPSNNRLTLYQMNLKKGWNEIGNPYLSPISWTDVVGFSGNTLSGLGAQLKTFSSGGYVNGATLQPYEGGFVFVDNDVTVTIPFAGQTATGGRTASVVSRDLGQDQWQLNLRMRQGELINELSGIGMQPKASLTMDQFDDVNPPRWIEYLEMDFAHPEYFARNFSFDVVPSQPEYTWEFTVESNQVGTAEISWDNSGFGTGNKELYLFDIAEQKPIDMRTESKYNFNPKESSAFRIYFGEHLGNKLRPDRVQLGKAFPNPSAGVTTIPFTLPGYAASFRVRLEVYDVLGNRVATLADGEFAPGFYQADWNSTGSNASDGLYVYRMVVADQNKNIVQTGKVVLKK